MANEPNSDRQRLLKLIDGDPATLKRIESKQKIAETSRKIREFAYISKTKAVEAFGRIRQGDVSFSWSKYIPLNRVLAVVLAAMSAYLVLSFVGITVFKKGNTIPSTSKYERARVSSFTELNPLGYYLDEIAGKDVFNPQRLAHIAPIDASTAEGPVSGLKLVGVDWGEQPIAMIEDTQAGKTYFVKKGDSMKNTRVVEVLRDRVKIFYNNRSIELK